MVLLAALGCSGGRFFSTQRRTCPGGGYLVNWSMKKLYKVQIVHTCGHNQDHEIRDFCEGSAHEVAMRAYFPLPCDDCIDASGKRSLIGKPGAFPERAPG